MVEITLGQKCALYERILKWLTDATEIRVRNLMEDGEYGYVELVGADPDDVKAAGWDDGLHLDYGSEVYMEDYGGAIEPKEDTRIITEIWFGEDPWATIKELKEQIQSLSETAKKEVEG